MASLTVSVALLNVIPVAMSIVLFVALSSVV